MRITTKGQVTIPQAMREALGFMPHTEVEFEIDGRQLVVRKKRDRQRRGRLIADHLKASGARMRMSSKQLLSLLRDEPDELDAG